MSVILDNLSLAESEINTKIDNIMIIHFHLRLFMMIQAALLYWRIWSDQEFVPGEL